MLIIFSFLCTYAFCPGRSHWLLCRDSWGSYDFIQVSSIPIILSKNPDSLWYLARCLPAIFLRDYFCLSVNSCGTHLERIFLALISLRIVNKLVSLNPVSQSKSSVLIPSLSKMSCRTISLFSWVVTSRGLPGKGRLATFAWFVFPV